MNIHVLRRARRQTGRLKRLSLYVVALLGVILLLIAAELRANTVPQVMLFGVASSMMASALFVFLTASREGVSSTLVAQGVERLFDNRSQAFTDEDWRRLLAGATRRYRVLGVANHGYVRATVRDDTREALTRALEAGVDVEILWLKPGSQYSMLRDLEEQRGTQRDTIRSIEWFVQFKSKLEPKLRSKLWLGTYEMLPTNGITWSDDFLIVTHYLPREQNRLCPGLVLFDENAALRSATTLRMAHPERSLAKKYMASYNAIREQAVEIDDAFVDRLGAIEEKADPNKPSEEQLRGSEGS